MATISIGTRSVNQFCNMSIQMEGFVDFLLYIYIFQKYKMQQLLSQEIKLAVIQILEINLTIYFYSIYSLWKIPVDVLYLINIISICIGFTFVKKQLYQQFIIRIYNILIIFLIILYCILGILKMDNCEIIVICLIIAESYKILQFKESKKAMLFILAVSLYKMVFYSITQFGINSDKQIFFNQLKVLIQLFYLMFIVLALVSFIFIISNQKIASSELFEYLFIISVLVNIRLSKLCFFIYFAINGPSTHIIGLIIFEFKNLIICVINYDTYIGSNVNAVYIKIKNYRIPSQYQNNENVTYKNSEEITQNHKISQSRIIGKQH